MNPTGKSGKKILITGAAGQLGVELTARLRELHGSNNVIATDIRKPGTADTDSGTNSNPDAIDGPFEHLDVLDKELLEEVVQRHQFGAIYHLAAILSAKGEKQIGATWRLNIGGLLNVLDIAREHSIERIFWPSSIAVFGSDVPRKQTPQNVPLNPSTVYGISKVAGELWCAYYHRRFRVDVRSVRYPGLVGWKSQPGGGTTDYAVEMLRAAINGKPFVCPVGSETRLPMMYMSDAVKAAIDLMAAGPEQIGTRSGYNVSAMSFSPRELANVVRSHINRFDNSYKPDERNVIASSWPDSIDDSEARRDWSWTPMYDLEKMVEVFFTALNGTNRK